MTEQHNIYLKKVSFYFVFNKCIYIESENTYLLIYN